MTLEEKKKLLLQLAMYWEEIDPEFKGERDKIMDVMEVINEDIEYMEEQNGRNKV